MFKLNRSKDAIKKKNKSVFLLLSSSHRYLQKNKMKFKLTTIINAIPEVVYNTWLSSKGHAAMTGAEAKITKRIRGQFSAWDGYITGKNLELKPNVYIKQSWRTVEFKEGQPDSSLDITLASSGKGQCKLVLIHSSLTAADVKYKQGWVDSYFEPMKAYWAKDQK